MQNTTIIIRAPVVVKSYYVEVEYTLTMSHVVYEIKCPVVGCELLNSSDICHIRNSQTPRILVTHETPKPLVYWSHTKLLNPSYIGHTRNNIRTLLNQHRENGAVIEHPIASHHDITNVSL